MDMNTSLCQFYQGRLLLHVTIAFEENKATQQLAWVAHRNSLKAQAEELVVWSQS